jgi:menaquinone-specific isochorismate synthase
MVKASSHRNLSRDDAPLTPEHGARVLFGRVSELVSALADSAMPRAREFVRLETALEPCDLLQWLRGVPAGARRYFRDRSAKFEVAGIGIAAADQFGAHESWTQRDGSSATASIWFVALPFDPARARDPQWSAFVDSECVLPLIELRRSGETHQLAVNITASTDVVALLALLERVANPDKSCVVEPALVRENDGTGEAEWTRAVRAGLTRIREGSLRKIVLARTRRYSASAPLDPVAVLMRLAARETRGFRFLLETAPRCAFLGVTPERLVSRTDRTVRSEAVAGTRPRGVDGVADRLLGESLLASAKDRREHELVIECVRDALASRALTLRVDAEPRLLRLAYVQHLATRVHAEMPAGTSDADLVALLHPTPAVAGSPVPRAVETLREFEPFDRGLYAGPIGVVSRDGAEIAVAIRSARIDGDVLTAFAGAGIVEGSDPAEEWRETGHKLLVFERLAN